MSDDASALALVSHDGAVALALSNGSEFSTVTPVSVGRFVGNEVASWCYKATSTAIFDISDTSSTTPQKLLAVGYDSGALAIFDAQTTNLLAVTRPHQSVPVRRLRYYPAFHLLSTSNPYPIATANSGLLALFASSGDVARLPATDILSLIRSSTIPNIDPRGAKWILWSLNVQDAVLDAAVCGSDPAPICELDPAAPSAPLRVVSVGLNPPITAFAVTSDRAFSARDAAKKAASTMYSAAKGFLLSRIGSATEDSTPTREEGRAAVNAVTRHSASWADDPSSVHGVINFGDVTDTARKSVNAVLQRGRRMANPDGDARIDRISRGSGSFGRVEFSGGSAEFGNRRKSITRPDSITFSEITDEDVLMRQKSRFDGDVAKHAARLPQNSRIVERVAQAPLPCNLLATCDTLGRIFLQDPRDLCVLRVLKGYRDAQVAWLKNGGPLLVVYAPRLNILELHGPLEQKRNEAFRLPLGSMLTQSTSYHVFSISPEGCLYELMKARKGAAETTENIFTPSSTSGTKEDANARTRNATAIPQCDMADINSGAGTTSLREPDYELVGMFTESIKGGHIGRAVECLQQVETDAHKVAHLLATLVTCASYIRTEVHIALASKAADIAAKLNCADLISRFDAHRKLAEAFCLLAADEIPMELSLEQVKDSRYGHRLLEDDLGAGLTEFALGELSKGATTFQTDGKRVRNTEADTELVNCERFILSHALTPTLNLRAKYDYELHPRPDLSPSEQIWLAKAYFMKLLETNSINVPTVGREHPTARDVFIALQEHIGMTEAEVTMDFVLFFLHMPLLAFLNTHASVYASPLRCAVVRLRTRFSQDIVDPIILDGCETTTRIPNAVLLLRLCAEHERRSSSEEESNSFLESLDRLDEVLLFRKLISGSRVPTDVYEKFTGRRCTGVPGDAERHAVACLIKANEFERASKILNDLQNSRSQQNLDWHKAASVSEAALNACRKKAIELVPKEESKVILSSVLTWIMSAGTGKMENPLTTIETRSREQCMREMRAVLLNAHQYIPDSSVDAVRCLQLAEAMSALIELEAKKQAPDDVAPIATLDLSDSDLTASKDGTNEMQGSENRNSPLEAAQKPKSNIKGRDENEVTDDVSDGGEQTGFPDSHVEVEPRGINTETPSSSN